MFYRLNAAETNRFTANNSHLTSAPQFSSHFNPLPLLVATDRNGKKDGGKGLKLKEIANVSGTG